MTWCVRIGKYAANSRPFTVIFPVPGRSRTRAMASLRRPVVWMRGLLTRIPSRSRCARWARGGGGCSSDAGLAALGQRPRDGLLGLVWVRRAAVHLQLAQHLATERTLREHAAHRELDDLLRVAGDQVLEALTADTTR